MLILKCLKCGKIIYSWEDSLRKYNLESLKQISTFNNLYPMIYLHLSNENICKEIQFYESNFKIVGYKIHPQTNYRSIDDIEDIPTSLPILVHTGIGKFDHPKNVINFSKRHNGPIILAHACRTVKKILRIHLYPKNHAYELIILALSSSISFCCF